MPPNSHSRVIAAHGRGTTASAANKAKARPNTNAAAAPLTPPSAGSSSTNPPRGERHEGSASGSAAPSSTDPRQQRRRQHQRQQQDNDNIDTRQQPDGPMVAYIPDAMRDFVHPYHGDFCYSFHFHPQLLVQLMAEGFLPIATSTPSRIGATPTYVLLPKLHEHRCVVPLHPGAAGGPHDDEPPESHPKRSMGPSTDGSGGGGTQLHVSRSVRKRSSRYIISCNRSFSDVVEACQRQHGRSSWLYPPLVEALTALHHQSAAPGNPPTAAIRASGEGAPAPGSNRQRQQPPLIRVPVRLYSIEVWREHGVEDSEGSDTNEGERGSRDAAVGVHRTVHHHPGDEPRRHGPSSLPPTPTPTPRRTRRTLVAGELGYTVGAVYTSLTGFTNESGAGTVQLVALGRWLQLTGFQLWDLGMEMEYKFELGAVLMPRHQFVNAVRELRLPPHGDLVLTCPDTGRNCRDVIDNK